MDEQNSELETYEITEEQRIFIMELVIKIGEAIRERNDSMNPRNDVSDATAVSITMLSIIYASCPEEQRANFKEAMKKNIDAIT